MAIAEAISLHWSEGTGWSTGRQSIAIRVIRQKVEYVSPGARRLVDVWGGADASSRPLLDPLYSYSSGNFLVFIKLIPILEKGYRSLYSLKLDMSENILISTFNLLDTEFWVGNNFPSAFSRYCSIVF